VDERMCADGVCAREWMDMDPVGMSERGCTDVCGRCGRKGVDGNGWGVGRIKDRVGVSERRCTRTCADSVSARERMEMGREKGPVGKSERGCVYTRVRTLCVQGN
jgi:hypothetical protein